MTTEQFKKAEPLVKGMESLLREINKAKHNVKILSEIKDRTVEIPVSNIMTDDKHKLMVNVKDLQAFYFDQQTTREFQYEGLKNKFNNL